MPAATMAWAAPAALGALGLYQQGQSQKKANGLLNEGTALNRQAAAMQLDRAGKLGNWADNYNPASDDAKAIDAASRISRDSIAGALKNVTATFAAGGGVPGLSSEFNVRAQGATNRAADPLREFAASQIASEGDRKGRALQIAAGQAPPGGLGDSFYKAMSMVPQSDPSGAASGVLQALMGIFGKKGGAGGSGDFSNSPSWGANPGGWNSGGWSGIPAPNPLF